MGGDHQSTLRVVDRGQQLSDRLWGMFGLFLPFDEDLEDSCTDESVQ